MKTSPLGVAFIALKEGNVLKAYQDSVGVWTIGVGHTASAGPPKPVKGMTITREESFRILAVDLAKFEARVNAALGMVAQNVFDAAVSFDFNTGAITKASWVKAFKAGDRMKAESSFLSWNKAGGKTLAGLVNRRKAEADMLFRGVYPKGMLGTELPASHDQPVIPTGPAPAAPKPVPATPMPSGADNAPVGAAESVWVRFFKWLFGVK